MRTGAGEQAHERRRGSLPFWAAFTAAPFAFLMHLVLTFFLADTACRAGVEWPLHLITLVAVGLCALGALSGWRVRQDTGAHEMAAGLGRVERTRFMANVGVLLTALFTLIILAQWAGMLVFSVCQRI